MKKILLLPIALLSVCCCSQKPANISKAETASAHCPTNGDCTIELLQNKSLNIKRDDLGGTYYQLLDNPGTTVIHFQYTKHKDPTLADGGYKEEVLFEIDSKIAEIKLEGSDLEKAKALYGRFCFCRGQTGYHRIYDGNLSVVRKHSSYDIKMDYKITEVPQLVKHFEFTVK
ncbi:MAG TPA: hypothetical protein VF676_12425 [Flavobacterium sp.]